jgi:hypothetical protein
LTNRHGWLLPTDGARSAGSISRLISPSVDLCCRSGTSAAAGQVRGGRRRGAMEWATPVTLGARPQKHPPAGRLARPARSRAIVRRVCPLRRWRAADDESAS